MRMFKWSARSDARRATRRQGYLFVKRSTLVRLGLVVVVIGLAWLSYTNLLAGLVGVIVMLVVVVAVLVRSLDRLQQQLDDVLFTRTKGSRRDQRRPRGSDPTGSGSRAPTHPPALAAARSRSPGPPALGRVTDDPTRWLGHRQRTPTLLAESSPAIASDERLLQPVPVTVTVLVPHQPPAQYVVVSDVIVGRGPTADIAINDLAVSRSHAQIFQNKHQWLVRPEAGAAKLAVNGRFLRPTDTVALTAGDKIALGGRGTILIWDAPTPTEVPPPQPGLVFRAAANTTPGGRPRNEDAHWISPQMLAVADGAGGEPAGATASATAIATLDGSQALHRPLADVVSRANDAVLAGQNRPAQAGMATTLDVARLARQGDATVLQIAHLGDGVIFFQDADGSVQRLTTPHRSQSRDGARSWLERSLGTTRDVEAQHAELFAAPGQRIVLATDGLMDHFGERRTTDILTANRDNPSRDVADLFVKLAVDEGAADNVTVVVADLDLENGPRR